MKENPKWFQKLFYKETVLAIKSSLDFLSYEHFKNDLILLLPQESKKSRIRIANNILHRFFPDKKLYGFLSQIWNAYQDELLLQEIIRYELLVQEPVIAEFVISRILSKGEGEIFSSQEFDLYIKEVYGREIKNLVWWLQSTVRDLGFISKASNLWRINAVRVPEAAFILLLHRIFALYPSVTADSTILADNYWKFTGIKDIKTVKNILYKAHLFNLLEYSNNNIKTCYTLEGLLLEFKPDKFQ